MKQRKNLKDKVRRFLDGEAVLVLATAALDGTPHAAAVFFAVDRDLNISFVTHSGTRKAVNMQENPKVSFSVGEHPPMNVQGGGIASIVTNEAERRRIFDAVAGKAASRKDIWPPIFRFRGDYAVFKVSPTWMRMLDLEDAHINEEEPPIVDVLI